MSASTNISICNLALGLLGNGKRIGNLSERTVEAIACNAFFEDVRDATLRDFDFPFSKAFVDLILVEEDPTEEWAYSYRMPADCLKARRIISGNPQEANNERVKYLIASDTHGNLILTNHPDAQLEYTRRVDVAAHYPSDFRLALATHLAAWIAPQVTGGDKFKFADKLMRTYQRRISMSQANAFNEEGQPEAPESEFIRGR